MLEQKTVHSWLGIGYYNKSARKILLLYTSFFRVCDNWFWCLCYSQYNEAFVVVHVHCAMVSVELNFVVKMTVCCSHMYLTIKSCPFLVNYSSVSIHGLGNSMGTKQDFVVTARLVVKTWPELASEVQDIAHQLMHWLWLANVTLQFLLKCRSRMFGPHCSTKIAILDGTVNYIFIMWE
jgi:hypothetical protein